MTFKFETGNDLILKSLLEARDYLGQAAHGLSMAGELIGEYELWRIIAGDMHEMQDETKRLSLRVAGCIEFIERESPSESDKVTAQAITIDIEPEAAPY
jgi:hypothetical protein